MAPGCDREWYSPACACAGVCAANGVRADLQGLLFSMYARVRALVHTSLPSLCRACAVQVSIARLPRRLAPILTTPRVRQVAAVAGPVFAAPEERHAHLRTALQFGADLGAACLRGAGCAPHA